MNSRFEEVMNPWTIGIVVILIYISHHLFTKRRAANSPPEPAGGWPLVGHLHLMDSSGSKLPYVTLGDLADQYGPIFTIRIGVYPTIVVSAWELTKECFTTFDAVVSSRPSPNTAAKIMGYDYINFSFAPYGAYWREIRKITASELFSTRRVEQLMQIRISEVQNSLKDLFERWGHKRDHASDSLLVEMKQWFGDVNMNVIVRTVAGKRYSGTSAEAKRCHKAFSEFFRLIGQFVLGDAVPFLGWLDVGGHVKDMKRTAKELDAVIGGWLQEHRQKRLLSGHSDVDQDFMDVMMSNLDGRSDLAGLDVDTVIKATCTTILAGATDTTSVPIIWALSLLLNHREALKKVEDELDEHVGKDRLVTESDISKLTYLEAVIKETLRLYPPGPFGGMRQLTHDCTLGGYHVKAGTRLILNLWKLHRDPRVWSDPMEFKPERFLTTHRDVDIKGQSFELLPFGGGRRACPAMTLGLHMTCFPLAAFLHAFQLTTPRNASVDMTATFGVTNVKTHPLHVLVKPRLPHSLYQ